MATMYTMNSALEIPLRESRTNQYFNCLTCRILFKDIQLHREHYTTEYHRYNLNRKITGLPAITLEEYEEKEKVYRKDDKNDTKVIFDCTLCRKKYNSEKQYKNHLTSTKHMDNMKKSGAESQPSKSDSSSSETYLSIRHCVKEGEKGIKTDSEEISWLNSIEYNYCLFCSHRSETMYHLLVHMKKKHSFFIPDEEYLISHKRLLLHLSMKIWYEYKCLWCNNSGRQLRSAEAARSHMIDKGHCKMLFEGEALLEYKPFYDYSSSYPDVKCSDSDEKLPNPNEELPNPNEELPDPEVLDDEGYEMKNAKVARLLMVRKQGLLEEAPLERYEFNYKQFYSYLLDYPDANCSDSDEELSDSDEELSDSEVLDDEGIVYEMKLPSGKVIGHRSLMRYYKQYMKAGPVVLRNKYPRDYAAKIHKLFIRCISLGNKSEVVKASLKKKVRGVQCEQKNRTKYSTQLQFKQNKLQKYFRSQTNV